MIIWDSISIIIFENIMLIKIIYCLFHANKFVSRNRNFFYHFFSNIFAIYSNCHRSIVLLWNFRNSHWSIDHAKKIFFHDYFEYWSYYEFIRSRFEKVFIENCLTKRSNTIIWMFFYLIIYHIISFCWCVIDVVNVFFFVK